MNVPIRTLPATHSQNLMTQSITYIMLTPAIAGWRRKNQQAGSGAADVPMLGRVVTLFRGGRGLLRCQ
jgi:hypothetical protein